MQGNAISPEFKERFDELNIPVNEGFYVGSVIPGMGAAKAGIQEGDVILSVDQVKIKQFSEQILRPLLEKYKGKLIKGLGDGWLLEFNSASECVEFGQHVQRALNENKFFNLFPPFGVITRHHGDL